ncbi:hypothetical protein PR048_006905 [Dryococelus australis]|uniref:Uncharacterized protein n=1 Tax=Dryococelus australis TaxID=614101 RepID=A0ABQ9ICA5_9NEOP|nr:hypothetical protein PR048_006905 [Dryococelus australis]
MDSASACVIRDPWFGPTHQQVSRVLELRFRFLFVREYRSHLDFRSPRFPEIASGECYDCSLAAGRGGFLPSYCFSASPLMTSLPTTLSPIYVLPAYLTGGETGDPRENPTISGIDRHDSHMRKSGTTSLHFDRALCSFHTPIDEDVSSKVSSVPELLGSGLFSFPLLQYILGFVDVATLELRLPFPDRCSLDSEQLLLAITGVAANSSPGLSSRNSMQAPYISLDDALSEPPNERGAVSGDRTHPFCVRPLKLVGRGKRDAPRLGLAYIGALFGLPITSNYLALDADLHSLYPGIELETPVVGRATVAERLACSPPTKVNRVQSLAGSLPNFRKWESCRTMTLVGGFFRGSPVSPALSFRRYSTLTSVTRIATLNSRKLTCLCGDACVWDSGNSSDRQAAAPSAACSTAVDQFVLVLCNLLCTHAHTAADTLRRLPKLNFDLNILNGLSEHFVTRVSCFCSPTDAVVSISTGVGVWGGWLVGGAQWRPVNIPARAPGRPAVLGTGPAEPLPCDVTDNAQKNKPRRASQESPIPLHEGVSEVVQFSSDGGRERMGRELLHAASSVTWFPSLQRQALGTTLPYTAPPPKKKNRLPLIKLREDYLLTSPYNPWCSDEQ